MSDDSLEQPSELRYVASKTVGYGPLERVYTQAELDAAVQAAITKPSPCGQKFSDGTPHPASLWVPHKLNVQRSTPDNIFGVVQGYCLICQSEEKLRGELEAEIAKLRKGIKIIKVG